MKIKFRTENEHLFAQIKLLGGYFMAILTSCVKNQFLLGSTDEQFSILLPFAVSFLVLLT